MDTNQRLTNNSGAPEAIMNDWETFQAAIHDEVRDQWEERQALTRWLLDVEATHRDADTIAILQRYLRLGNWYPALIEHARYLDGGRLALAGREGETIVAERFRMHWHVVTDHSHERFETREEARRVSKALTVPHACGECPLDRPGVCIENRQRTVANPPRRTTIRL